MGTGRYVLLERIGVGGMAEVFRANSRGAEGFERPVAIKRILSHLVEDSDFVKMFVDEAKIAVQLQHPNIVQILDLGRDDREYFIAMEYVHGKDLRALQDGLAKLHERLPPAVAVYVAMKVCEALHHAHFATGHSGQPLRVVHRDVTPQNVMLSYDGEVKVTDFGLARAAGRATETQVGVIKGKLAYMAPEGFAGVKLDHRADVFGAAVLLWEMLTGRRLFLGKNDLDTVARVQQMQIPPLRSLDPHLPGELDEIVARGLARDRELRYQTAEELHDDLEAFAYSRQLLVTSGQLGEWLRERFPPEGEKKRAPDVATREIRLADVGPGRETRELARFEDETPIVQERPRTMRPSEIEGLIDEEEMEPEPGPGPLESADAPFDDLSTAYGDDPALPADEIDDVAAGDMAAAAMEAEDEGEGEIRDTVQPPPLIPDVFDDTTGKLAPRVIDAPTVQRYDRELVSTTVPRAPAVPHDLIAWDDADESTDVNKPPKR